MTKRCAICSAITTPHTSKHCCTVARQTRERYQLYMHTLPKFKKSAPGSTVAHLNEISSVLVCGVRIALGSSGIQGSFGSPLAKCI